MAYWLVKTEPTDYSFADLQRDGRTAWAGVTAAPALKHLREMNKGESVFVYHTGKERQIVGIARTASGPYRDPTSKSEKSVVIDLEAVQPLQHPVTLAQIKSDPTFRDFGLVRISRLSIMPVTKAQWNAIVKMSKSKSQGTDHRSR
jgi:predicted RNA-binding protein with PUA-like domain